MPDPSLYKQIDSVHFAAESVGFDHVSNFINNYKYAKHELSFQKLHLLHYIKEREHELQDWHVIIEARKNSQKSIFLLDKKYLVSRSWKQEGDSILPSYLKNKAVLGPGVILASLPKNVQEKIRRNAKDKGKIRTEDITNNFNMPILVLTPFRNSNSDDQILITYSILMPKTNIKEPFKDVLVNADVDSALNEYDDFDEDDSDDFD